MRHIAARPTARASRALDVVIEAVVEKLDVKQPVLAEVEALLPPTRCSRPTRRRSTSTRWPSRLRDPSRLVGLHFFNPVHRMPLVEVIVGKRTAAAAW